MGSVAWRMSALMACTALLAPTIALSDPRDIGEPPPPLTPESIEARRVKLAQDMAAWLPRLVGRFRYEGLVEYPGVNPAGYTEPLDGGEEVDGIFEPPPNLRPANGLGDCVTIGTGPGVHCVINVDWIEEWNADGTAVAGGVSFLGPATMLYGMDKHGGVMRYLLLDTDGLAAAGEASLKRNTLITIFEGYCASKPQEVCRQVTRIYAPPDGRYVQTTIEVEGVFLINLYMYRVTDQVAMETGQVRGRSLLIDP